MNLDTVAVDTVVAMHYTLTLDGGDVVDSSSGKDPLHYLHGHGNIVPGLEEEMTGHKVGDKFDVRVPPEAGYGQRREDGVQEVPKGAFPADLELSPGMMLHAQHEGGAPIAVRVVEVGDETVKVDFNHPLAGQSLNFAVEVVSVRSATQDELTHGHVHGPGGAH